MSSDGPIRIGKVTHNGHQIVVVEMFGVSLASASTPDILAKFDEDPDLFRQKYEGYFLHRFVSMFAEQMHGRRLPGWLMATPLSPPPPNLPREGEEQ